MTRLETIQMMAKNNTEENNFKHSDALLEGHNIVEGWDVEIEEDDEEEEFEFIAPIKPAKPHFLDRKDRVILGGFLRNSFYKETKGKNPFVLTNAATSEELACRCCNEVLATPITDSDVMGAVKFTNFFTKEKDALNRNLSETMLALLQLFDWSATCSCGEIYYGYLKLETVTEPVSISDKIHKMTAKAASLAATAFSNPLNTKSSNESSIHSSLQQMTLFDFLDEEQTS